MCANGGLPLKIFRCVWLLYTGSPLITLTDWVEDRQRSCEWLDPLVKQLNSADDLDATSGEFFTELVFVKNRSRGAGANGKAYNPGRMSYETMLKKNGVWSPSKRKTNFVVPWPS